MTAVVDASAVGAVIFGEAEAETIKAHVQDDSLIAPELIDFELANIGVVKARRDPESTMRILAMLNALERLTIARVSVPPVEVAELALRTGLTAYDASYLWLAIDRDAELITLDRELARADRLLRGDPA